MAIRWGSADLLLVGRFTVSCCSAAVILLLCCSAAVILLPCCCYPAALLLCCCYPAALLPCCCYPAALLLCCCCPAALLLCCSAAVVLLLCCPVALLRGLYCVEVVGEMGTGELVHPGTRGALSSVAEPRYPDRFPATRVGYLVNTKHAASPAGMKYDCQPCDTYRRTTRALASRPAQTATLPDATADDLQLLSGASRRHCSVTRRRRRRRRLLLRSAGFCTSTRVVHGGSHRTSVRCL